MLTRPPDKPRPDAKRQRASAAAERRRAWPQTFDSSNCDIFQFKVEMFTRRAELIFNFQMDQIELDRSPMLFVGTNQCPLWS